MGGVSAKIKELDEALHAVEDELHAFVMIVPNVPHESVPQGSGPEDNPVVRTWGENRFSILSPNSTLNLEKI